MNAVDLKERIQNAYSSIESYEDSGSYKSMNGFGADGWFRTVYLKSPRQLRFEWSPKEGEKQKHVLMVKGDLGQHLQRGFDDELLSKGFFGFSKSMRLRLQSVQPYADVICGVRGLTHGFSDYAVSPLVRGKTSWISDKHALLSEANLDGEECFRLRAIVEPNIIWIAKSDFTVRRVELGGAPLINEIFGRLATWSAKWAQQFSPQSVTEEMRFYIENGMGADTWTIDSVRINHFTNETFPEFDFKEISL